MNIILDTNVFVSDFLVRSNDFEVVLDYLKKTNSQIVLPQIIYDEIIHVHKRALEERYNSFKKTIKILNLTIPSAEEKINVPTVDLESISKKYGDYLLNKLSISKKSIVPYKNEFLPEILSRADKQLKPFRGEGDKGFKDTAIWLTIKDFLVQNSEKQIVFISNNINDFAESKESNKLHESLVKECGALNIEVFYYKSIHDFISEHSTRINFITEDWIENRLAESNIEDAFVEYLDQNYIPYLEDWAREHRVLVRTDAMKVRYIEDFVDLEFHIYEMQKDAIVAYVDFGFLVGVEFDWFDESPHGGWPHDYTGGTERETFRFRGTMTLKIKNMELIESKFTDIHLRQ